jgi:hypothetical protein
VAGLARLFPFAGDRSGLGEGLATVAQPFFETVTRGAASIVLPDGVFCALAHELIFDNPSFCAVGSNAKIEAVAVADHAIAIGVRFGLVVCGRCCFAHCVLLGEDF